MADLPVTKLNFTVRLIENGKTWRVDLAWPDREPEHVKDFDSEAAANTWIASRSEHWLRRRLD
jgi:hypothetical protein